MSKLISFTNISLDGYFADHKGDMSWAHRSRDDAEWNTFVAGNAQGGGRLLFGRVTYQMMAGFWPTPMASQSMPTVAKAMNNMAKVVISRTLTQASWQNTTLLKGDLATEIRQMKQAPGTDTVILGSGSLVTHSRPKA